MALEFESLKFQLCYWSRYPSYWIKTFSVRVLKVSKYLCSLSGSCCNEFAFRTNLRPLSLFFQILIVHISSVSKSIGDFVLFPWFKIGLGKMLGGVFPKFFSHNEFTSWRKTTYCQSNCIAISLIRYVWTPQSWLASGKSWKMLWNISRFYWNIDLRQWALKNCAKFYLKVGLYCQTTLVVLNGATWDTFIPLHFFKN